MKRVLPLFLILLAALVFIPSVHAGGAFHTTVQADQCASSCVSPSIVVTLGDFLIVNVACWTTGQTIDSLADSQGNIYTQLVTGMPNGRSSIWAATASASGSMTVTATSAACTSGGNSISFAVDSYTGITAIGQTNSNVASVIPGASCTPCSDSLSLTAFAGSIVYEVMTVYASNSVCPIIATGGVSRNVLTCFSFGGNARFASKDSDSFALVTGSGSYTASWSGDSGGVTTSFFHGLIELQTSSVVTSLTQCYGNCGSPAVKLINTNSTHSMNFNNSITLLYLAQSNLNGVINNVTTSIAKSYSNGLTVFLGVYTVDRGCTNTAQPFTSVCPGFLQANFGVTNPSKGKLTMPTNVNVVIGQWMGIAVSASFGGLDLNNTNTAVTLYQANGVIPTPIFTVLNTGPSSMGLWAFVTGSTTIIPIGGGGGSGCTAISLQCGLQLATNGLGGGTFGALMLWLIIVLSITFSLFAITLKRPSAWPIFIPLILMISVILLIGFSLINLLPSWIPLAIMVLGACGLAFGIWRGRMSTTSDQSGI